MCYATPPQQCVFFWYRYILGTRVNHNNYLQYRQRPVDVFCHLPPVATRQDNPTATKNWHDLKAGVPHFAQPLHFWRILFCGRGSSTSSSTIVISHWCHPLLSLLSTIVIDHCFRPLLSTIAVSHCYQPLGYLLYIIPNSVGLENINIIKRRTPPPKANPTQGN